MATNNLLVFNLVFFALICCNNKLSYLDERIVNGIRCNAGKFPFIASISVANPVLYPRCGGSILRKEYPAVILTAAHCLTDSKGNMYQILVDLYSNDVHPEHRGDSGNYTEWKPIYTVYHELYNATTFDNDIGLIFLDANLTIYHEYEEIIIANDTRYNNSCCYNNEQLTIIGYGYKKYNGPVTDTLEYSHILFMNRTECNIKLTKWYIDTYNVTNITIVNETNYWEFATKNEICAMGNDTDACQGDSGGPLMKINTNQQVGIISTGFGCNQNIPGIYTNLGLYYDWIDEQINDYNITFNTTNTNIYETKYNNTINSDNIDKNIDKNMYIQQNIQFVIGCSVVGFVLCIGVIIYLIKIIKRKKSEKYNRMKEDILHILQENNVKKKTKTKKKKKIENTANEMEGALYVNTTSQIEMN